MAKAKEETGLNTICEVISAEAIDAAVKYVDMIQIGARNMQNFQLLKEAGRSGLPVLLKRGLAADVYKRQGFYFFFLNIRRSLLIPCKFI